MYKNRHLFDVQEIIFLLIILIAYNGNKNPFNLNIVNKINGPVAVYDLGVLLYIVYKCFRKLALISIFFFFSELLCHNLIATIIICHKSQCPWHGQFFSFKETHSGIVSQSDRN